MSEGYLDPPPMDPVEVARLSVEHRERLDFMRVQKVAPPDWYPVPDTELEKRLLTLVILTSEAGLEDMEDMDPIERTRALTVYLCRLQSLQALLGVDQDTVNSWMLAWGRPCHDDTPARLLVIRTRIWTEMKKHLP